MKQIKFYKKFSITITEEMRDFLIIERRRMGFKNVDAYLRHIFKWEQIEDD